MAIATVSPTKERTGVVTFKGNPLTLRQGDDYLAFGSMSYYWRGLEGKDSSPDYNTVMTVTRKGIVNLKRFTPLCEWWERGDRTPKRVKPMTRTVSDWYELEHQETIRGEDGEPMMIDPMTGTLERVRDLWPH